MHVFIEIKLLCLCTTYVFIKIEVKFLIAQHTPFSIFITMTWSLKSSYYVFDCLKAHVIVHVNVRLRYYKHEYKRGDKWESNQQHEKREGEEDKEREYKSKIRKSKARHLK